MRIIAHVIDGGCLCMFLVAVVILIYRYVSTGQYGQVHCDTLLNQGDWLDPKHSSQAHYSYNTWSPPACMMHKYHANDIQQCIGERRIVFIGDSRLRQMFWAVATKLNKKQAEVEMMSANRHGSMTFKGFGNSTVEFIWDPYLNSTRLSAELTKVSTASPIVKNDSKASVIMIGGGLWFAKDLEKSSLQRFSESIDNISRTLGFDGHKNDEGNFSPSFLPQEDHSASLVMFAPVPKPLYAALDTSHAKCLALDRIQPLQDKMLQAWHLHQIPVPWAFDLMTDMQPTTFQSDGIHIRDDVADSMVDLVLNAKCNDFLTQSGQHPTNKTCCSRYPQLNWTQQAFVFIAWSSFVVTFLLELIVFSAVTFVRGRAGKPRRAQGQSDPISTIQLWLLNYLPPRKIMKSISILLLVCFYSWWADRTVLMNKLQKQYSDRDFMVLCLIITVAGLLSIHRSMPSAKQKNTHDGAPNENAFLSRDQTDEWKGWMQLVILIYHYTGASKVLWIYKIVRLLVASYLFLTGYGNTIFFYEKADYSLKRVAGSLFRLNILSCILPFIMRTDYVFYYFAPLVTFWYLVIYMTMAIGKCYNRTHLLILKILISAVVMTIAIFHWPGLFDTIFSLLAKLCNIHWDKSDWLFRLRLDNYIVYVGMLVGAFTAMNKAQKTIRLTRSEDNIEAKTSKLSDDVSTRPLSNLPEFWFRHKKSLYLAIMVVGCLLYAFYAFPAKDKEGHNEVFPMVSLGPILAFVALRNCFPRARQYHSRIFAWMGRHSLETFVLQYHIWLAADTKGILSTGFFQSYRHSGRWADFVLLTVLFLWICWHVASASQVLTAYLVEPKSMQEMDDSGQDLPRTASSDSPEEGHSEMSLNPFSRMIPGFAVAWLGYHLRRWRGFVAEHLWTRLLLIMLALWLLNLTYP